MVDLIYQDTKITICKIEFSDAPLICKILKKSPALKTTQPMKEILKHIKEGTTFKCIIDDKIVGIWCSIEYPEIVSLSFFYTDESIRRKPYVYIFFKYCYDRINNTKPIVIKTKDTTGFSRYVKKIGEDIYQFIGLR